MGAYWYSTLNSFLGGGNVTPPTTTTQGTPVTTTQGTTVTTTKGTTVTTTTGTTVTTTQGTTVMTTKAAPVTTTSASEVPVTTTTFIDVSYGVYDLVNLSNYLLGTENNINTENWTKYDKDDDKKLTVADLIFIRQILTVWCD